MARSRCGRFLRGLGIVVAILVAITLSAKYWLGHAIKGAVNGLGPQVMGVPVKVDSVNVNLLRGKVELQMLTVGNPEGFDATPFLFQLDGMLFDLDMRDMFHGKKHITDIIIDGPHVWYHKKLTSSNVSTLLDILEEKYPSDGKPDDGEKGKDKDKDEVQPVVIDHVLIKEGTVGVRVGVGVEVPLLEIELKDIGKDGALMPVQVVKILVTAIVKGTLSAVANIGGAAVDAVEGVGKAAVSGVKGVAGAVGSLFGGSSDTNATPPEAEADK